MVGLQEHPDQRIVTLSGGQRRQLDVAVGMVRAPSCFSSTSPARASTPQARREFRDLVHRLTDLERTTIVLTMTSTGPRSSPDRILILADGRIVADGRAQQLARRVAVEALVRWSVLGELFVHPTTTPPPSSAACWPCTATRSATSTCAARGWRTRTRCSFKARAGAARREFAHELADVR